MERRGLRGWLARLVLIGFEPDEVDEVLRDLRELAEAQGRWRKCVYFWVELLKYPVRGALDRLQHRERNIEGPGKGWSGMDGPWNGVDGLLKDARYAVRSLARSAGFTATAVAIMTLSMAAATAIFSVVKGVLLDPLPVEEPERLVSLWLGPVSGGKSRMTPGNFTDISELDGVFEHVAAFSGQTASLARPGDPIFLRGGMVTPAYFDALGVRPVVGRTFLEEEGESGAPSVVVLSHHVWQQMFGADPGIVGRSLAFDGSEFEVVGVVSPGMYPTQATVSARIPFTVGNQDFFVPFRYDPAGWSNRRSHVLGSIGRLAPGVTFETADAALGTRSARLRASEPLNANEQVVMTHFTEEVVGDVRFALLTLLGTVGLMLLIAIVNVGALFVLRADDRQPEMAIRVALGAPRGRLLRQLGIESVLVVAVSSFAAVMVGRWALDLMRRLVPYQIPRLSDVAIDGSALLVTVALGLLVAVVFGLAPSLRLWGDGWALGTGRRGQTAGLRQRRLQGGMVAIQAGLGVIVLVGAALLTRSFVALRGVDTGFDARETWVMSVPASLSTLEEIVRNVRDMPGVATAAVAYGHPLERNWGDGFLIEGVALSDADARPSASLRPFGENYFATAGIEVQAGRVPDGVDMAGSVAYAVINEALRDAYFPAGDAIGSRIVIPTAQRMLGGDGVYDIIGVVRDVRFLGPDQPPGRALYVPLSHFQVDANTLLVRPERAGLDVLSGVRQIVRETAPGLAVQRPRRLQDVLDDLLARPRFNMMLLVSFGIMGLVLCGLGAYGLMGRVVVARFREIGIRMALGADRVGLARSVMGSALRPMVVGGLVGIAASFGLVRLVRSLLFEVSPGDPASFLVSSAFVLLVGVVAALVPTLRALSIDPASSLRND